MDTVNSFRDPQAGEIWAWDDESFAATCLLVNINYEDDYEIEWNVIDLTRDKKCVYLFCEANMEYWRRADT